MTESPLHMRNGDSAATMYLLCGVPIRDASWTQNPDDPSLCTKCRALIDAERRAAYYRYR